MTVKKSGYAALVGRPNVGKSTLLNTLLGEKVSITSPKPQTTRWQILGIKTLADTQIIFVDTPGVNREHGRAMNRYLNRVASSVLQDVDVIVFMVDATTWRKEDEMVLDELKKTKLPVILAVNKIDTLEDKSALLPTIQKLQSKYPFKHIVPISALDDDNVTALEDEIAKLMPEGPMLFPDDQVTDKSIRFQAAEIIREKLIMSTEQEIPYALSVEVEDFKQDEKLTEISAIIWVERRGQKAIVIGSKGERLKKVGTAARRELEKMLGTKVFIRLWVKIKEDWTDDDRALRGLGYE